ncbi:hypothetical protein CLV31_103133 [Algoriphagus aquaeductus]|uniref:YceI-like domain-containing protein n=1 Tax=Algoriphagus aquaeductus TaxID=475299 RepID=A0A326S263_9BACT|nr:hypothetical protein [Algoriphagus aquaeductus]PZV85342.1 hypothetical protein CLV31_103133 [Algoriphagus aquaeductus]
MRILLLIGLILFSAGSQERKELVITQQKIQVSGYTSVGKFNCDFSKVGLADTLRFNSGEVKKGLEFKIPVKHFSCGNFLLNNDFRSTLKAEDFPFAHVRVANFREKSGKIFYHLSLDLVGKKLEFPDLMLERSPKGLSGKLILNFELLNLSPPSKFGGLVKVEDQLDLEILLGS